MELLLKNGDYLPDGKGGLCRAEGEQALLQRVLWKLTARRGQFPFLPKLGSRLYTLPGEKPSARESLAQQYAAEALEDEPTLSVSHVETEEREASLSLTVFLTGQEGQLEVTLEV